MGAALSALIKSKRKEMNLSQEALANKLGVSKVAVCWYESGERTPTLENFEKLLEVLKLDANKALGREVDVVAEDDVAYSAVVSKQDLKILKELKKRKKLYKTLYDDPARTVELIDRKMK